MENPPAEHQQPPQECDTVATVALKLPPFWPADPAVWFAQVEAQFATRNITRQLTKFHYVIAALNPEVAAEVRDLVLHPPEDTPYDHLRSQLIKRTEASEQRRLQQLLTAEELGDRKPSQLLRRMQQLLGDSGPAPDSSFVRELFLQRLPPNVRMVLASSSTNLTLAQLADMADRIAEVATPTTVSQVSQEPQVLEEVRQLTAALNRMIATLDTYQHSGPRQSRDSPPRRPSRSSTPHRSSSRSASRSSSPSNLCWYHCRFGPNTRKCRPPCARSGNEPASR